MNECSPFQTVFISGSKPRLLRRGNHNKKLCKKHLECHWESMSASYANFGEKVPYIPTRVLQGSLLRQWFAVQIRYRFEKKVAAQLRDKGCEIYLPLRTESHSWSDRQKIVATPIFPGYAFVRLDSSGTERRRVLETAGLIGFVGFGKMTAPIPLHQIENLQRLQKENARFSMHPFAKAGQRVRVRGGSLEGLEGIFLEHDKGTLVISIDAIQRSLAIEIRGYELELI